MAPERGTLTLVAVPIGNPEDITLRALRLLREADLIVAEDSRVTRKLLAYHSIETPLLSLASRRQTSLVEMERRFEAGGRFVFVTDAGMPNVNDPGSIAVHLALRTGLQVTCAPGASALLAALALSGFPASPFVFAGSPPRARTDRILYFQHLAQFSMPIILFDSARTLRSTLKTLSTIMALRPAALFRNLTRIDEWQCRGNLEFIRAEIAAVPLRGEFTLVIGKRE